MTVVELRIPSWEEMAFRQELLADPATMAYNAAWGGTIDFPPERWEAWYRRWVAQPEGERFYRYLWAPEEQAFVGEAAWHLDRETGRVLADVIVHSRYRGRDYGGAGLDLLCRAAREAGWAVLYDHIALDNQAAGMFLRRGFREESRDAEGVWLRKDLKEETL